MVAELAACSAGHVPSFSSATTRTFTDSPQSDSKANRAVACPLPRRVRRLGGAQRPPGERRLQAHRIGARSKTSSDASSRRERELSSHQSLRALPSHTGTPSKIQGVRLQPGLTPKSSSGGHRARSHQPQAQRGDPCKPGQEPHGCSTPAGGPEAWHARDASFE